MKRKERIKGEENYRKKIKKKKKGRKRTEKTEQKKGEEGEEVEQEVLLLEELVVVELLLEQ